MVCMIWQETFGNGVRIGTTVANISGCCAGGLGTTLLISCVWLTASTTRRAMGTTPSDFVVWQDVLNHPGSARSAVFTTGKQPKLAPNLTQVFGR